MKINSGPSQSEEREAVDGRKRKGVPRKRRWKQSGNNWMKQMNPEVKTELPCIWWKEDVRKVKRAQVEGDRQWCWCLWGDRRVMKTKCLSPVDRIKGWFQKEPAKRQKNRWNETDWQAQRTETKCPDLPPCRRLLQSLALFQWLCAEAGGGREGRSMYEETAGDKGVVLVLVTIRLIKTRDKRGK